MKIPFRFFILIVLLILPVQGFSQLADEENIMLQQITVKEKTLLSPKHIETQSISILQDGMNNQVLMEQTGSGYSAIHQVGSFNVIFLQQSISGSNLKLIQTGESNQYHGTVSGTDIEMSVMQHGGFNTIDQYVAGEQLKFKITQEGDHNTIQHLAESSGVPLQIQQSGSDMKLIIRSSN